MSVTARVPALQPFRIRSFRFQWPADLLASWAFEMEGIILGWFVLISTGSVLLLALFGSLQFLGTLISPLYGMAGDRIGNRALLCLMRGTYLLVALVLMALFLTGNATPIAVFALSTIIGLVRPSDITMRNLTQVEGMSLDVLRKGIKWDFETFAQYLAQLQRSGTAVNVAAYVGHSSLRTWVMGSQSNQREATADEIAQMAELVRDTPLNREQVDMVAPLMIEACVAEASLPIARKGRFGPVKAADMLQLVARRAAWLSRQGAPLREWLRSSLRR